MPCVQKANQKRQKKKWLITIVLFTETVLIQLSYTDLMHAEITPMDIDITAIVRGNRVELQKKLKKMWDFSTEVGLAYDVIVSPTVIPYDEFEQYKEKLPYYRNIVKEGRKIG